MNYIKGCAPDRTNINAQFIKTYLMTRNEDTGQ